MWFQYKWSKLYLFLFMFQMIPSCSALNLIQKYDDINKPYCTIGLIDITEAIACNIRYSSHIKSKMNIYAIQVTRDNLNFDLSEWNLGPDFFPYITKQIYSQCTLNLSNFWSLEVLDLSKWFWVPWNTFHCFSLLMSRSDYSCLYLRAQVFPRGLTWFV
jgi:hypothetical protein